jgi:stage II sporulation protein D
VLLAEDKSEITLEFQAQVVIRNADTDKVLWQGRHKNIVVKPAGERIQIDRQIFSLNTVIVESDSPIAEAGRPYRGIFQIWNQGEGKLALLNILDVEDYIRGIMKAEISPRWPTPALRAQAVVARSYALFRRQVSRTKTDQPYDLTSSVLSQVYVGIAGEHERSNKAVSDTAGEVLLGSNGDILEALYHACCGGATEAAEEVWGGPSPLKSVKCPYCRASPHYNWQAQVSITEFIKTFFGETGASGVVSLEPATLSSTGRWREIRIRYGDQEKIIRGVDFRQRIGPDVIRSTCFRVRGGEDQITFSGQGWGHGVGLCQWGAKGMEGTTYKQILHFYYPSSLLVRQ